MFAGTAQAQNYPAARALAGSLRPQGLTPKADPAGLGKARDQISKILTGMEKSQVSGGPGAADLVQTAYEFFVPQVGPVHRNAATGALTAMWTEARALGAFDAEQRFTGKITKGPDTGQTCVFEYIVTMDKAPHFSRDVANVRLVSPGKKRAENAPLTVRETAYLNTLQAIQREIAGMKSVATIEKGLATNALGQTKAEAEKIWRTHMERDGEKALGLPSLLMHCRMVSSPAKRNGYKWVVQADVTNMSPHATEIELECIFMGTTGKYRQSYVMGQPKTKVLLRGGQAEKILFSTPLNEGAYKSRSDDYEKLSKADRSGTRVSYRGAIVRALHAKGDAGSVATDPVMLALLKKESTVTLDSLPKLHLDIKLWPKYVPGE